MSIAKPSQTHKPTQPTQKLHKPTLYFIFKYLTCPLIKSDILPINYNTEACSCISLFYFIPYLVFNPLLSANTSIVFAIAVPTIKHTAISINAFIPATAITKPSTFLVLNDAAIPCTTSVL